ncbi:MAG: DUF1906 domain-containing protein [Desulfosporosinus sp.]|nr:DUF1906 domain-containing protein [Desulfosporosinus sp.]
MEAIDCSTTLTSTTAAALKVAGIVAVGRYLGYETQGWSKSLSPDELSVIQASGLSVFLIWESNPTTAGYFSYSKGVSDAQIALEEAAYLGAPNSTAIYFAVDFDAQASDMTAIIEYFSGVRDGLKGQYLVGAYGSYSVLQALQASSYAPDKYWQTYAWSNGMIFSGNDIYQYQNDVTLEGIAVDLDTIQYNSGCWPEIGCNNVFANLVIYEVGPDVKAAQYLADYLKAPTVSTENVTPELLACATKKYKVGGPAYPGAQLISGSDRYETMNEVLKFMGI